MTRAEASTYIALLVPAWGVSIGFGAAFVVRWLRRSAWKTMNTVGKHMIVFAVLLVVESIAFLALGLGLNVPAWVFLAVFWASAALMVHRYVILVRVQRSNDNDDIYEEA